MEKLKQKVHAKLGETVVDALEAYKASNAAKMDTQPPGTGLRYAAFKLVLTARRTLEKSQPNEHTETVLELCYLLYGLLLLHQDEAYTSHHENIAEVIFIMCKSSSEFGMYGNEQLAEIVKDICVSFNLKIQENNQK